MGLEGLPLPIFLTASSKGFTIWPEPNHPKSPPFDLLGQVEYSLASCSKRAPFCSCLKISSAKLLFLTSIWLALHSTIAPYIFNIKTECKIENSINESTRLFLYISERHLSGHPGHWSHIHTPNRSDSCCNHLRFTLY